MPYLFHRYGITKKKGSSTALPDPPSTLELIFPSGGFCGFCLPQVLGVFGIVVMMYCCDDVLL
jgi:hypothetical protein